MAWILIVMAGIYGGHTYSFQEFDSARACEGARQAVMTMRRSGYDIKAVCVPKDVKGD